MNPVSGPKKRQDLPRETPEGLWPGLWIVATPLGNLGDMSERARRALSSASRILCEDTRRTAQLLQAMGIEAQGRLERLDAHSAPGKLRNALEWLQAGENLALVTDAGTPAISDPGSDLVSLAHENGIRVTPVPGPSAVTALLSVAGFGETQFLFHGFFPRKASEQIKEVKALLELLPRSGTRLHVWYESPQRVAAAFESLVAALGETADETRICAAKELTKTHERVFRGSPAEVLSEVREHVAREGEKGEWSFALLLPESKPDETRAEDSSDWVKALRCMLESADGNPPIAASEAARRVSQYFGVAKKLAYEKALRISGKKN